MKTISVATVKGGVGKTIIATHLAAGLARLGCRTLLVDLDPQAHATSQFGRPRDTHVPCIGDVLLRESSISIHDIIIKDVRPKLDLAPAGFHMAHHERQLYTWALRLTSVLRALQPLRTHVDTVVIDCPPYLGGYLEAALHASDLTLAPIPALAGALGGLRELQSVWTEMRDGREGKLASVINLWDARTRITNTRFIDALARADIAVLKTKIPRAEIINQSALGQTLVYDKAPHHPVSDIFDAFAYEVWDFAAFGIRQDTQQEEAYADMDEWTALEQAIAATQDMPHALNRNH